MTTVGVRARAGLRRRLDACHGDDGVGRRPARFGSDRGVTAIEFVFLTPLLFFMIFATVQFGLYLFADHVAQAAAQAGARKARAEADANPGGWRGLATEKANSYIDQLGPELLLSRKVSVVGDGTQTVGVEVTGTVPNVFPGLNMKVHSVSQGPVERFVPDE